MRVTSAQTVALLKSRELEFASETRRAGVCKRTTVPSSSNVDLLFLSLTFTIPQGLAITEGRKLNAMLKISWSVSLGTPTGIGCEAAIPAVSILGHRILPVAAATVHFLRTESCPVCKCCLCRREQNTLMQKQTIAHLFHYCIPVSCL